MPIRRNKRSVIGSALSKFCLILAVAALVFWTFRDQHNISWSQVAKPLRGLWKEFQKSLSQIKVYIATLRRTFKHHFSLGKENILFDKGFQLHTLGKFDDAYVVFKEAWELYNATEAAGVPHAISELQIMDFYQHSAWKINRPKQALMVARLVLAKYYNVMTPESRMEFDRKVRIYTQEIINKYLKKNASKLDALPVYEQIELAKDLASTIQYNYCRDEYANPRSLELASDPRMYCRLDDRGRHPFLIYSPVKEEIINFDPVTVIFHDIVSPKQAAFFISEVDGKLSGSGLIDKGYLPHERRSRTAWVPSTKAMKLTRYLEAVTGMNTYDTDGCEPYQISYYGIGGHYLNHRDYLGPLAPPNEGDRIATLLLYLNNPTDGGHTAFDGLKFRINPEKGAGLFFYNLFRNEWEDERSLHCGCPVIHGEKWVATKWFRARGQVFHRPCPVRRAEPFSASDFSMPEWIKWSDPSSYSFGAK